MVILDVNFKNLEKVIRNHISENNIDFSYDDDNITKKNNFVIKNNILDIRFRFDMSGAPRVVIDETINYIKELFNNIEDIIDEYGDKVANIKTIKDILPNYFSSAFQLTGLGYDNPLYKLNGGIDNSGLYIEIELSNALPEFARKEIINKVDIYYTLDSDVIEDIFRNKNFIDNFYGDEFIYPRYTYRKCFSYINYGYSILPQNNPNIYDITNKFYYDHNLIINLLNNKIYCINRFIFNYIKENKEDILNYITIEDK